jgi:hypothetical protein
MWKIEIKLLTVCIVGLWVDFGCGWAKLNVVQSCRLVRWLAALLILRGVGFVFYFLFVIVGRVGFLG